MSKILTLKGHDDANEYAQKKLDIDFWGTGRDDTLYAFENKIRFEEYDDILIETISNTNSNSPGWIHVSKADYLVYVFYINKLIKRGYIFDLEQLQEWWVKTGANLNYPIYYGGTPPLYKTQNMAVPLKDIPIDCVVYHPIYGLLNPIGEEVDLSYFR